MENDQKSIENPSGERLFPLETRENTVIHLHRQDGPQFKDSIEIGSPGKGGSVKIYFDASDPADAEVRIRNVMRLKKITQTLYQEV